MADISGLSLNLTTVDRTIWGNKRVHTLTGFLGNGTDTWPTTAGVSMPASAFGLGTVEHVNIDNSRNPLTYDYSSSCIQLWTLGSGSVNFIVASGLVPTSGQNIRYQVIGTGLG